MKQTPFIPFYVPGNTFLHRLPLMAKLVILFFYIFIVFISHTALAVLCLCLLMAITTLILKLPFRNRAVVLGVALLLFVNIFWPLNMTVVLRMLSAFGKIVCLMLGLSLFDMTTKFSEILLLRDNLSSISALFHQVIYIISTMLAVLPSVQYDLQRAIDAETIRRGRPVKLFSLHSWMTILTIVLVRTSTRGERLAESVINRGYVLEKGLTPLKYRRLHWQDLIWAALTVIPGLIIFTLTS